MLTIALSKGKLLPPALALLKQAGLGHDRITAESRQLVFRRHDADLTLLIVRPSDVPTYVEYGAADLGVVGKDVLLEQECDVYEPLDLQFGACRISLAGRQDREQRGRLSSKMRVATKYPTITERYFNQKATPVEIIKLYGSIELAPLVGLADCIVDLVSTGETLKAHQLIELEVIARSTARLIVNRASLKMKHRRITEIMQRLDQARRKRRAPASDVLQTVR